MVLCWAIATTACWVPGLPWSDDEGIPSDGAKPLDLSADARDLSTSDGTTPLDLATRDLVTTRPPDLAAPDLALRPPDLAVPDLALPPPDLRVRDLALPPSPDLRVPDLAVPPDLRVPDLAVPPDLGTLPDLVVRDLTTLPDLAAPPPSCLVPMTITLPYTIVECSYPGSDRNNCWAGGCTTRTRPDGSLKVYLDPQRGWMMDTTLGPYSYFLPINYTATGYTASGSTFCMISGRYSTTVTVDCPTGKVTVTGGCQDGWPDPCGVSPNFTSELTASCTLGVDCK